ncbi:DUF2855 family protein [Bradyrhizobium sp. JYMT SZCCT0428]|uniref:DUF2855 family protein n=1 Tax=Bradyrhizobium sp. JYMT SZCCT0428 TaxID=2807673 RepID=UPI0020128920|nr:DUF2855 family protein [Bradyrhizobium sp. JYMT SZCCT0428]
MNATDFIVARNDLQQCKSIETQLPDAAALPADALLVKVTHFAFTANNITYAVMGDALKYWQLFPAPKDFGNIPVWGFGEVIASKHPNVAVGETLFGYFPMATHLVIEAADVTKRGLRDGAAHRQVAAPVYNAYARVSGDPAFTGKQGDYQALLRPLFMLSFLVDDFLAENDFYGARRVMLSSASSKTAYGLAHLLHRRDGIKVIGLTSAPNVAFVKSLGCYDEVVTYDAVTSIPADSPVTLNGRVGPGAYPVDLEITAISSRPSCSLPNGYRLAGTGITPHRRPVTRNAHARQDGRHFGSRRQLAGAVRRGAGEIR